MNEFELNILSEDEDFISESDNNEHVISFVVETTDRLDKIVSEKCDMTRSAAAKLVELGAVTVSSKPASKSTKPKVGETVCVTLPEPVPCDATPQNIPIDIVFEDEHLLVVNKPRGMVVHPAPGNPDKTLVNALMFHCEGRLSGIGGVIRPGIVHRIDKDTSGLLIVAKNDESHLALASQIKEHSFTRIYQAIVIGNIKDDEGTIELPIGRHPKDRKKMAVTDKNSKHAITHYKVLTRYNGYTHLELKLETGRTHQIRVHMSHKGHPVLGDPLYCHDGGRNKFGLEGQCLHAKFIGFVHPITGQYLEFDSQLPEYFNNILEKLKNRNI